MSDSLSVIVCLTPDEALVLFDLLQRWEGTQRVGEATHPGEQVAVWTLSALLEPALVEPFSPGHRDRVDKARHRLAYDRRNRPRG